MALCAVPTFLTQNHSCLRQSLLACKDNKSQRTTDNRQQIFLKPEKNLDIEPLPLTISQTHNSISISKVFVNLNI